MKPARVSGPARIADLVFLIRPPLLCASATFFFAGAIAALRQTTWAYESSWMLEALPNLGIFLLLTAAAFVVNQIFDAPSDAVNKKNFLIPSGAVTRREAAVVLGVIYAALIGLSALWALGLFGPGVGLAELEFAARRGIFVEGPHGAALGYLIPAGLVLGVAYSVPPLRLKARPVADLFSNVAGFGWIGFLLGWEVFAPITGDAFVRSLPYAIAMAGIFLNTCVADERGDRAVGDRTSCVVFGVGPSSVAALALTLAAVATALLVDEPLCAIASAAAAPGLAAVALRRTPRWSVVASQIAALAMLILVSVLAPLLAVISAVAYAASKAYYRRRFGVSYPRLGGADLGDGGQA